MPDIDQCNVVASLGGPMCVRHARSCVSEYCAADYQCDQVNRHIRRVKESK